MHSQQTLTRDPHTNEDTLGLQQVPPGSAGTVEAAVEHFGTIFIRFGETMGGADYAPTVEK